MIVKLPLPLPVTCELVMPPATDVDSVAVPLVALTVNVTLSLVGSEGSASEMPLTRSVPPPATDCPPDVVIASGPATVIDTFVALLLPNGSAADRAKVSVPLKPLIGP